MIPLVYIFAHKTKPIAKREGKRRDNFTNKIGDERHTKGVNANDGNCNAQKIERTEYFGRKTNKNLGRLKRRDFQIDRLNKSR